MTDDNESRFEDILDTGDELTDAEVTAQAHDRYSSLESYQAILASKYRLMHFYYKPPNGDQWPEDLAQRPGMIHITHNIIMPGVDTEARIEAMPPRIELLAGTADPDERARAEIAEKVYQNYLEQSEFDVWLGDATKPKAIYGKVFLHPFWNTDDERPDVTVIEMPENLRVGWARSDFSEIDWAIYEYSISPLAALQNYPEIDYEDRGSSGYFVYRRGTGDHQDPIETLGPAESWNLGQKIKTRYSAYQPSDYETDAFRIWDYWFRDREGEVYNAVFVEGVLAKNVDHHPELPGIPYIPIENDHEPGSPEGIGMVEPLIDIQLEINRALSHYAQVINDNLDPAWQVDADSVPPGEVPHGGEMIAAGDGHRIMSIDKPLNQFPIQALVTELYKSFHFQTGLPEILFSMPPGAQTAGRALAVQIEASANRISPRRNRLYRGIKTMLQYWGYMIEKVDPQVKTPDGNISLGEIVKGFHRWKIVAPEVTPRDNIEHTTNTINKLQAKAISLETAMTELGMDSPLEEIQRIETERTNPKLFPGDTQAFLAVNQLMMQLQMQAQQAQQAQDQMAQQQAAQNPAGGPQDAMASAQGQQQIDQQAGAPTLGQEDNQGGPTQPMTVSGGPPPPFGNQTLIRATPTGGAQALQQIKIAAPGAPGGAPVAPGGPMNG
jgi:hypothetical protein